MTDTLYRMRGLDWVKMHGAWPAKSPIGCYFIWENQGVFHWQFAEGAEQLADSLPAAQSAAEAHYRARMAEGLVPVKVLGELPMTADGVVALAPATVYFGDSEFVITKHITTPLCPVVVVKDGVASVQQYQPVPIGECYSTRAAAEAAKKEP